MAVAKHTKAIINALHGGLKSCHKYLKKWKIQLNTTKTQAILFPFNKSAKRKPNTTLTFNGEEIKFTKTATYLGLDLDEKLTFKPQLGKAAEKSSKALSFYIHFWQGKRNCLKQKHSVQVYDPTNHDVRLPGLAYSSKNSHQEAPNRSK